MPGKPGIIDWDFRREKYVQHIAQFVSRIGLNLEDVLFPFDQSLRQQKPRRQLVVMTGRAHRDSHGTGIHLDFQRLFCRHLVALAERSAGFPTQDLNRFGFQLEHFLGITPKPGARLARASNEFPTLPRWPHGC